MSQKHFHVAAPAPAQLEGEGGGGTTNSEVEWRRRRRRRRSRGHQDSSWNNEQGKERRYLHVDIYMHYFASTKKGGRFAWKNKSFFVSTPSPRNYHVRCAAPGRRKEESLSPWGEREGGRTDNCCSSSSSSTHGFS